MKKIRWLLCLLIGLFLLGCAKDEISTVAPDLKGVIDYWDDDDPYLGDPNAPVTVIEFSDFACSSCRHFHNDQKKKIKEQYIDTGKVRWVFRNLPLPQNAYSQISAEASECADEQGQFWPMHDLLFEHGVDGGKDTYIAYARRLNLNVAKFTKCIEDQEQLSEIRKDFEDGTHAEIYTLPSFIINDKEISGSQPYGVFKFLIEGELRDLGVNQ